MHLLAAFGKILVLKDIGLSNVEIAQKVSRNRRTVDRIVKRLSNGGTASPKKKSGRPRKLRKRDERMLVKEVRRNRRASSAELRADLISRGVNVSASLIRRQLCQFGYKARRPKKKTFLTAKMIAARLQWAKDYKDWTTDQWKNVIWSDESRFNLFHNDDRSFVRRKSGEEYHPDCLQKTVKHPVSVMIWGCINWYSIGRLYICEKAVNQDEYLRILQTRLLPSINDKANKFGDFDAHNAIFQDDSAPCHRAKRAKEYLVKNNVKTLSWPGNSPDLNPI